MVQAYILASANMYDVPRPPRRGSHRPAPSRYPPLNDRYTSRHSIYDFDGYAAVSSYVRDQDSPSLPPLVYRPDVYPTAHKLWKQAASVLPAKRFASETRFASPTHREERLYGPASSRGCSLSSGSSTDEETRPSLDPPSPMTSDKPDHSFVDQVIRESYARSAPQSAACQSSQKRCMYPSCAKISVSRGLCRGHGGGRRCHVPGCTKSAQSRSNFCWAHGGGQRCDADQCMRSRKSKRFCVAHLNLENGDAAPSPPVNTASPAPYEKAVKASGSRSASPTMPTVRALPSLGQALSSASRSAPNLPPRGMKLAAEAI